MLTLRKEDVLNKFVLYFIIIIFFLSFSCSTDTKKNDEPIEIKSIQIEQSHNRMPKESDFQVDLELHGIVNEENLKRDIQYKWLIEYVKLDIKSFDTSNDLTVNYRDINYYIDIDKNPLNAILSVYKEGYYKITLSASNINETKLFSIIVKIGDPELPNLFVKLNIPKINKADKNDFRGRFFLGFNNGNNVSQIDITELPSSSMMDEWYKTGIKINPFESFHLEAGTHIIDAKPVYICSLNKTGIPREIDGLLYDFQNIKEKQIKTSPLILKDLDTNTILSIYKTGKEKWSRGEIMLSYLTWGYDENKNDQFLYFENKLNNTNKIATTYINTKYLIKIFIGSVGVRLFDYDYFVYFGPEGIDSEEFDVNKEREIPGLPYGYLIGKLGKDGTPFPIGNSYDYINSNNLKIYYKNTKDTFVEDLSDDI